MDCKLFDTAITNISSLEEDMLKALTHHIVGELKTKLRRYANNNNSMYVTVSKHSTSESSIVAKVIAVMLQRNETPKIRY